MTDRTATTPRGRSTVVPSGVYSSGLRPEVPPTRPRGHRDVRARNGPHTGSWQVFGLAGRPSLSEDTYWPSLPGPCADPVRVTAVVPAHRCGAAPDSHRVPSYDTLPGGRGEPTAATSLRCVAGKGRAPSSIRKAGRIVSRRYEGAVWSTVCSLGGDRPPVTADHAARASSRQYRRGGGPYRHRSGSCVQRRTPDRGHTAPVATAEPRCAPGFTRLVPRCGPLPCRHTVRSGVAAAYLAHRVQRRCHGASGRVDIG